MPFQPKIDDAWYDMYLDLYNIAKKLGDAEWQRDILHLLLHPQPAAEEWGCAARWEQVNTINLELASLYRRLRGTSEKQAAARLWERIWELKLQRVVITKPLYSASTSSSV